MQRDLPSTVRFHRVNDTEPEWRDLYHWLLTLRWPAFVFVILAIYLLINLGFACAYYLSPGSVYGMRPHSWTDAFFFSVETLATVGYGHMYPNTLYGHLISTAEIIVGVGGLAVITGLIFVRFSRPTARMVFSHALVMGVFNGEPCLMLRVANLRHEAMAEAEFRMMLVREEETLEKEVFVRFHPLLLQFDRLIVFPAALTIRHIVNEASPLYGLDLEKLRKSRTRLLASVVCIDSVIPASVQTHKYYSWRDIRWGHRFVEIYRQDDEDELTVDYGRLHDTEEIAPNPRGAMESGL